MPIYVYHCPENEQTVEALHSMQHTISTWGELCEITGTEPGVTSPDTPIKKLITGFQVSVPLSNNDYKSKGFKKLVRKEKGVYENVTATDGEAKVLGL
ncbi:MAG: zinc ribbon domain-containing protein [Synechococcaceae cyanobacterium RL_1_2]|nr:zinc ribbon domain-containing protein [Synechococcaceae cyanobacterium RL_1_2]